MPSPVEVTAAMVLEGYDHAEVGADFDTTAKRVDTPFEGVFGVSADGWFLCRRGTFRSRRSTVPALAEIETEAAKLVNVDSVEAHQTLHLQIDAVEAEAWRGTG